MWYEFWERFRISHITEISGAYTLQKIFHGTENFPRTACAVRFLPMRSAENFPFRGKFSEVYIHLYCHVGTVFLIGKNVSYADTVVIQLRCLYSIPRFLPTRMSLFSFGECEKSCTSVTFFFCEKKLSSLSSGKIKE